MHFRVENLGPLREAEIDLGKDLIVLAGPNNTGKTYLAWSVNGLHNLSSIVDVFEKDEILNAFVNIDDTRIDLTLSQPDWDFVQERVAEVCQAQLSRIFASTPELFARTQIELSGMPDVAAHSASEWNKIRNNMVDNLKDADHNRIHFWRFVLRHEVWSRFFPRCTLFPAERIALNIFAKELALNRTDLVNELLDADVGTDTTELLQMHAARYAWPIRRSLRVANDLANLAKGKSAFADLAEDLESAVLGGQISVSNLGEILFTPHRARDHRLPVHLTASVVKSLASLVFYFRHQAREHDFLIIDEPELNLHPDAQRRVIRVLAKAVNRGFKIMMSTHSDYVLRELNHLVMLSDPKESVSRVANELGYDRASILQPEKLGVYLFKDQTAKEVPVTLDGFEVETIEQEIAKLNADAQAIYAARFE